VAKARPVAGNSKQQAQQSKAKTAVIPQTTKSSGGMEAKQVEAKKAESTKVEAKQTEAQKAEAKKAPAITRVSLSDDAEVDDDGGTRGMVQVLSAKGSRSGAKEGDHKQKRSRSRKKRSRSRRHRRERSKSNKGKKHKKDRSRPRRRDEAEPKGSEAASRPRRHDEAEPKGSEAATGKEREQQAAEAPPQRRRFRDCREVEPAAKAPEPESAKGKTAALLRARDDRASGDAEGKNIDAKKAHAARCDDDSRSPSQTRLRFGVLPPWVRECRHCRYNTYVCWGWCGNEDCPVKNRTAIKKEAKAAPKALPTWGKSEDCKTSSGNDGIKSEVWKTSSGNDGNDGTGWHSEAWQKSSGSESGWCQR
jgi:hypothetical protein